MADDAKTTTSTTADAAPVNGTTHGKDAPAEAQGQTDAAAVNSSSGTQEKDSTVALPADSPAPWTLKCEAYGLPFKLKPGQLPPGLYHPLDTPPEGPGNDDFQGVRAAQQILANLD